MLAGGDGHVPFISLSCSNQVSDFSRAEICKIGIDWCNKLEDLPDTTNVVMIIDNLNGLGLSR